jgi:hypothetical protein
MSIAGPVSRARLSRYSHVRMEAKRRALDGIATRQREADEKAEEGSGTTRAGGSTPIRHGSVITGRVRGHQCSEGRLSPRQGNEQISGRDGTTFCMGRVHAVRRDP